MMDKEPPTNLLLKLDPNNVLLQTKKDQVNLVFFIVSDHVMIDGFDEFLLIDRFGQKTVHARF